jgi:DNA recombination protein RmuC
MNKLIYLVIALQAVMFVFMWLKMKSGAGSGDGANVRDEFERAGRQSGELSKNLKQEILHALSLGRESQDKRLDELTARNDQKFEQVRLTIERRLESLQKDNSAKLDQMRHTVDEKLQSTLEKRLGESFKIVGDRLEQVHKGLGEMQGLATEVGSFKQLMTGIKTRGTWGEVQLASLLEQIFIADHYEKQVMLTKDSREAVDFAIKLPDKSSKNGFIYLPIDAKFPMEDYQRLVAAQDAQDMSAVETSTKALANTLKAEAKKIKDKYIKPPHTTDFAVLYVPTESLYAEVLRIPGLSETLQREYRVTVSGPTTIAAILNSYQLGFRTLAIAEQTSQVWETLALIKGDFGKFGDLLEKTRDKLVQATNTIDGATTKSRTIERRLSKMEKIGNLEPSAVLEALEPIDDGAVQIKVSTGGGE